MWRRYSLDEGFRNVGRLRKHSNVTVVTPIFQPQTRTTTIQSVHNVDMLIDFQLLLEVVGLLTDGAISRVLSMNSST